MKVKIFGVRGRGKPPKPDYQYCIYCNRWFSSETFNNSHPKNKYHIKNKIHYDRLLEFEKCEKLFYY